jgi:undecaprenyl diphosphate synthase
LSFNASQSGLLSGAEIPRHVAIIMDGNGRWAKKRLLNRIKGHEKGVETVRAIVRVSGEMGIQVLTLYAFSTENWQRPNGEIEALMGLLKKFLLKEEPDLIKDNVRLKVIGQLRRLPDDARAVVNRVISSTAHNKGLLLNLALSYGGRTEIVEMVQMIAAKAAAGELKPEGIDESTVSEHLYTHGLPDPDLMIRTSGEMRISNFLLWQLAYSELYITPTLWPDFTAEEYIDILRHYQQRERRFGKVSANS